MKKFYLSIVIILCEIETNTQTPHSSKKALDNSFEKYNGYSGFSGSGIPSKSSDNSISKAWHILISVVKAGLVRPFSILVRFDLSKSHIYDNSKEEIPLNFRIVAICLPSSIKNSESPTRANLYKIQFYKGVNIDHLIYFPIFVVGNINKAQNNLNLIAEL